MHVFLENLWRYRNQVILIMTPIVLLPLPLLRDGQEALCGYAMILMAVYWVTEAMPIPATACIPVFLFPMLGLVPVKSVVVNYMKDIIMMFFGGLAVAIALEKCNLHKRIATRILIHIGTQPKWLMLGFMLPTWFLSMWISNTATSAMMLPMVEAVLDQLDPDKPLETSEPTDNVHNEPHEPRDPIEVDVNGSVSTQSNGTLSTSACTLVSYISHETGDSQQDIAMADITPQAVVIHVTDPSEGKDKERRAFQNLAKGLTLCVAYAANTGGIATLTGTNPNLIMKGQADQLWEERGLRGPINYPNWMIYGLPTSTIVFILLWFYMQFYFLGIRPTFCCSKYKTGEEQDKAIKELIRNENNSLGPIKFAEYAVIFLFVALISLWFFRDPGFITGWGAYFEKGFVRDAVPAVLIATSLFVIPYSFVDTKKGYNTPPTLMDWDTMQHKMPWGTFLLLGGGFALAEATTKSGLAIYIGNKLQALDAVPGWLMVFLLCIIVAFLTEITSNSATCTILMPIVASMATATGYNPLYLMLPVTLSTSFAFMLPVATPPNAIAFSYGRLRVIDMIKAGFFINFFCVAVVTIATHTWGMAYFELDELPWAINASATE